MTKMRLDAADRGTIETLNGAAEWLEEISAGARALPDLPALADVARDLRRVKKNLEDSWSD
jgi:hypothetical protein